MLRRVFVMGALLSLLPVVACGGSGNASSEEEVDVDPPETLGHVSSALVDVAAFGANPAQLKMHKYVPAKIATTPKPLVVVLHGCTQTPSTYEAAGWNSMADEWGFYVVYAEQNTTRNNSSGCFNWGGRWKSAPSAFVLSPEALDLTEIQRGNGENESIKEMVDQMKKDHPIDEKRVFITGLSAGGAMTALMLATWPDVFAGGAIFAGIPYGCATNQKTTTEAANCLKDYTGANAYLARTPQAWGDLVRGAAPSYKGTYPRVQIWAGTVDSVVNHQNQVELMKQWTDVNKVSQTAQVNDNVESYPHAAYKDASGNVVVETYSITGKDHGTEVAATKPINPANTAGPKCGQPGSYIIEAGICSTYYAAKFFGLDQATAAPQSSSSSSSSSSTGGTSGLAADGGASGSGGSTSGSASGGDGGEGHWVDGHAGSTCSFTQRGRSQTSSPCLFLGLIALTALIRRRKDKR